MKKLIIFCVVVLYMVSPGAQSADADTKAAIEKIFSLIGMEKIVENHFKRMETEIGFAVSQMDVPPSKKPELKKQFQQLTRSMRGKLSWNKLKEPMIAAYSEAFTKEEIKQLMDFYQSPLGRKMLAKNPEVSNLSMQLIEQQMLTLMPKMHQLQHDMTIEFAQLD